MGLTRPFQSSMNGRWPAQVAAQTGQTGPKKLGATPSLFDTFGPQPASRTPWAPTMSVPSTRSTSSPGGTPAGWEGVYHPPGGMTTFTDVKPQLGPTNTPMIPGGGGGTAPGWEGSYHPPGGMTTFPNVVPPPGQGPGWEGPNPSGPPTTFPPSSGPTNSPGWPSYAAPGAQTIGSSFWSGDTLSVPTSSSEFGPLRQGLMEWLSSQRGGVNAGAPAPTQSMSQLGPGSEFYNNIVNQLNPAFAQRRGLALAQAKEAAGNLTGSSYGNALGTSLNRSLLDENQQILDYATNSARSEQQRQAADADRAAQVGNANAGRISDLFGRLGTAGVGTNEIAQTGGAGAVIPAILGLLGQGGFASGGGSDGQGNYGTIGDILGSIWGWLGGHGAQPSGANPATAAPNFSNPNGYSNPAGPHYGPGPGPSGQPIPYGSTPPAGYWDSTGHWHPAGS